MVLRRAPVLDTLKFEVGPCCSSEDMAACMDYNWINKYHFEQETVGNFGVPIHTDSGFMTILQDDQDVGGLEAMDISSGTFFPINPLPNTFVVNLGDMATIWSNGRFCNVKHRVQCKEPIERISIAAFLLGPMNTDLEPPSEFVDSEHPRLYKPISHDELRRIRLANKVQDGEVLKLITMKKLNDPKTN